jgi:uncharacterized protein YeeX (DUF496 family)
MTEEQKIQNQKERMATDLYDRISAIIFSNSNSRFTPEWQNIEKRILDNQDTVFFIENPDFKITVTMRHNLVSDSIKVIQDSIIEQKNTEHRSW